jgi:hypothetical protein
VNRRSRRFPAIMCHGFHRFAATVLKRSDCNADSNGVLAITWYCDPGLNGPVQLTAQGSSGRSVVINFSMLTPAANPPTPPQPPAATCSQFVIYVQNRWSPPGASLRSGPDHNSTKVGSFGGNAALTVNGWTYGSTPFPSNPAPYNSNIWFRLANGSGWVSFAGVRAATTSYAPTAADGGPSAPTPSECRV